VEQTQGDDPGDPSGKGVPGAYAFLGNTVAESGLARDGYSRWTLSPGLPSQWLQYLYSEDALSPCRNPSVDNLTAENGFHPDERGDKFIQRMIHDASGTGLDDLSIFHDSHPVGQAQGLKTVVGGQSPPSYWFSFKSAGGRRSGLPG